MRELVQNKINEYMHEIEVNDNLDENNSNNFNKESISTSIKVLEERLEYYKQLDTEIVIKHLQGPTNFQVQAFQ